MPACRLTVTVLSIEGKNVRLGISAPGQSSCIALRSWTELPLPLFADKLLFQCWRTLMSIHILIADPDEYVLDSYREHLEQHGFDVVTATTGLDCVHRLRDSTPDVLVLDPVLPWGGGDGVLALMRDEPGVPLVPVIVLSYGGDRSILYRLSSFRIDDYQTKPLSPKRLAERIGALLGYSRLSEISPVHNWARAESRV